MLVSSIGAAGDPNAPNEAALAAIGLSEGRLDQVRSISSRAAESLGEHAPANVTVLRTTRGAAVALGNGARVGSDGPAYLVTMHGQFTANEPRPRGAPAPEGTVVSLVLDADTLELTDYTVSRSPVDLANLAQGAAKLGHPVPLVLGG
jgi:hypothetical protein